MADTNNGSSLRQAENFWHKLSVLLPRYTHLAFSSCCKATLLRKHPKGHLLLATVRMYKEFAVMVVRMYKEFVDSMAVIMH
jgi:hypothetical protein